MKKITFLLGVLCVSALSVKAQTILEVGADKTYTTVGAAWTAAKTEAATEITINVAAGTYIEAEMGEMASKKVRIVGAGADKTILKRSDITDFGFTSSVNPGRFFQLNAATSVNLELTLENISFQTAGYISAGGGGALNCSQAGQKITIKNCNFKNIFARAGAIIQASGATIDVVFENCFFEECGSFDNNSQEGIIKVVSGTLMMTNCSFVNNNFDVINKGTTAPGTDRNTRNGQILTTGGSITSIQISNCNFVNNKYINGNLTFIHPIISIRPVITAATVAPDITLATNPIVNFSNVLSVGNIRAGSMDVDVFYDSLITTPTVSSSVFNVVKKFNANAIPTLNSDVTGIAGMTINPTGTMSDYFEMEGATPKIVTNSLGVKSLVRKTSGIQKNTLGNLSITTYNGKLIVTSEKLENIEIYNLLGERIAQFNRTNKAEIALAKGVYVVKADNNSTKVLVR